MALLFGRNMTAVFLDTPNPEILTYAYNLLIAMVGSYIFLVVLDVLRFTIQGMGFAIFAIFASVMELISRGITSLILVPEMGVIGIIFAHPLAWLAGDILLIPAFIYCLKKVRKRSEV